MSLADHRPAQPASSQAALRDVAKAQSTKLRWSSPSAPKRAEAASDEAEATSTKPAPTKSAPKVAKRTTRSRMEAHAEREAEHVRQTSATKPKEDPFADPFFDDESAEKGPRLASRPRVKAEPIISQPMQLQQPQLDDAALPDPAAPLEITPDEPMPPAGESPLQPTPDEGIMSDEQAEMPEGDVPDERDDFVAQGYEPGQLPPCPSPLDVKQIREITTDISAQAGEFPPECPLGDVAYQPRMFVPTTYTWKASALCSKPLYFQQAALERYGHSWGPLLQPFVSGADFYLRVFALPYMIGMDPPNQCVYALGWYRPGSCAPMACYPIPISLRGGLMEAGVILGAAAIIP